MKRILSLSLALLLFVGVASATNIPTAIDAKNRPIVWTESVYNNSSTAIGTGLVVQWDFDSSDVTPNYYDDMCPWVKTTDAADDIWTAGVTSETKGIAAKSEGTIIILGPAIVDNGGVELTANGLVSANSNGTVMAFAGGGDEACLGVSIKDEATQQGYQGMSLIYVDITRYSDD